MLRISLNIMQYCFQWMLVIWHWTVASEIAEIFQKNQIPQTLCNRVVSNLMFSLTVSTYDFFFWLLFVDKNRFLKSESTSCFLYAFIKFCINVPILVSLLHSLWRRLERILQFSRSALQCFSPICLRLASILVFFFTCDR